jgi:Fe-S-cluster-containing dehydrogenase component
MSSETNNDSAHGGCRGDDCSCGGGDGGGGSARRTFLKGAAATIAGMAGLTAALAPLRQLSDAINIDEWLQKHYQELTPEMMRAVCRRLEKEMAKEYGVKPTVKDYKPMDGVEFAYALNLGACIGCRRCVEACSKENNHDRATDMSYIRVLEMEKGSINLETSNHHYDHETVPQKDKYYMPVQCQHCRDAPCVKVCPVKATWTEKDGIVVVDYNWCIGCRYCEAACPYEARRFNFKKPEIPSEEINPNMSYLGNRIRPQGVMEKCHFCLHRTREGKMPACMEVCPVGARVFGNILDPNDPINYIINNKRVFILKEDLGTIPRFYYFFD